MSRTTGGGLFAPSSEESLYTVAETVAETQDEYLALVSNYSDFIQGAYHHATQGFRGRFLITVAIRDEPGIVADFARVMSDLDCNIQEMRQIVAAGQVLLLATVQHEGADTRLTGTRVRDRLEGTTRFADGRGTIHVVSLFPFERDALAGPGQTYRFRATKPDEKRILLQVTQVIADRDVPLLALASWVESGTPNVCTIDLFFLADDDVALSLEQHLVGVLEGATGERSNVTCSLARSELEPLWAIQPSAHLENRAVSVSVVGRARAGYVHRVLEEIGDINIVGSCMAVLSSYTGLVLVLDLPEDQDLDRLRARVLDHMHEVDRKSAEFIYTDVSVAPVPLDGPTWSSSATHTIEVVGPDRPGVLAQLASLTAHYNINIVGSSGEQFDALCKLFLYVAIPPDFETARFAVELEKLRSSNHWSKAEFASFG